VILVLSAARDDVGTQSSDRLDGGRGGMNALWRKRRRREEVCAAMVA